MTLDEMKLCAETTQLYNELIMAVERKVKGETRHETALRYITQAEHTLRLPQTATPPTPQNTRNTQE